MAGVKGKSGGARTGSGRKTSNEKKIMIKVPVYKSMVDAKGGEEKAKEIMLAAFVTAPFEK